MHLLHPLQLLFLQILRCDAPITSISNAFLQILRCYAPLKSDTNAFSTNITVQRSSLAKINRYRFFKIIV